MMWEDTKPQYLTETAECSLEFDSSEFQFFHLGFEG